MNAASCNVYKNGTGTIAPGSITVGESSCFVSCTENEPRAWQSLCGTSAGRKSQAPSQQCRRLARRHAHLSTRMPLPAGPVNTTGTKLAVAWNDTTKTATIVFQGSQSQEDWITVRAAPSAACPRSPCCRACVAGCLQLLADASVPAVASGFFCAIACPATAAAYPTSAERMSWRDAGLQGLP